MKHLFILHLVACFGNRHAPSAEQTTAPTWLQTPRLTEIQPIVAQQQQALHDGDWKAYTALLHPESRLALLQGFDDPEIAALVVERRFGELLAATPGSPFAPSVSVIDVLPEGPQIHAVVGVDGTDRLPVTVTLQTYGEGWALVLPEMLEPGPAPVPTDLPWPIREPSAQVQEVFAALNASEALLFDKAFHAYVASLHPHGPGAVHDALRTRFEGQQAPPILEGPPEELVEQIYALSLGQIPGLREERHLIGGTAVDDGVLIVYRSVAGGDGWATTALKRKFLRPHDGSWKTDLGRELQGADGLLAPLTPQAAVNTQGGESELPALDCPEDAIFELRLAAKVQNPTLVCTPYLRDVRWVEASNSFQVLLDQRGQRSLATRTAAHIAEQVHFVLDGQTVLSPIIREPITGWVLTISSPDTWSTDDLKRYVARLREAIGRG